MRTLLQYIAKQSRSEKIRMAMETLFAVFAFNSIQRYVIISKHLELMNSFKENIQTSEIKAPLFIVQKMPQTKTI